jgi:hypothetical protein
MGRTNDAIALLESLYAERSPVITILKTEPAFDALRSDPRFQALLSKVGLSR